MRIALAAGRPVEGVRAEMAAERARRQCRRDRRALREELLALLRDARSRGVKLEPESSQDPIVRGWLELGAISVAGGGASLNGAADAARWRARYPNHPATELLARRAPGGLAGGHAAAQARAAPAGQRPGGRLRRHDPRRL